MINITFPDGNVRQYESGVCSMDIAKSISEGLAKKILVAEVNGVVMDLSRPITHDSTIKLITWDDETGKNTFWHSSAHLMAEAVEMQFPGVKFWVGPALENGFYYDMDLGDRHMTEEDLIALETKMADLAKQNNVYIREEISKEDAVKYFTEKGKRALPLTSIPHSNDSCFTLVFLFGPRMWVTNIVVATKPKATRNISAIGM